MLKSALDAKSGVLTVLLRAAVLQDLTTVLNMLE